MLPLSKAYKIKNNNVDTFYLNFTVELSPFFHLNIHYTFVSVEMITIASA